jgi:hypothetical protein
VSETNELLPLIRKKVGDFLYPYGAFPDDDYEQVEGYRSEYFTPDADDQLGDRYRTTIVVSAEKIVPLFLDLCTLLPAHVHVVLERASEDIYTDRDVFVSDSEVDLEQFVEVFKAFEFALAEDGMLGIGAFSCEDPLEIFLTDHKEIIVFTPTQDELVPILERHHVPARQLELFYERGHTHLALTEYRGLRTPNHDYLQVVDTLRHVFGLTLQQDDDQNVDEDGNPLGLVPWRAVAVVTQSGRARPAPRRRRRFLQEFLLTSDSRQRAHELLEARLQADGYNLESVEELFRVDIERLPPHVRPQRGALERPGIWYVGDKAPTEPHGH